MLVIDVNVGHILLYDLVPSYITSRHLVQFLSLLCYTFPSLVDLCNQQASKLDLQPVLWKLSRIDCGKLQGLGTLDCGIFCLKFFEYLVTRANTGSLQQSRMLEFRLQYGAELGAISFCTKSLHVHFVYIIFCIFVYFPIQVYNIFWYMKLFMINCVYENVTLCM